MKIGLSGKTKYATTSRQVKIVVVFPYLTPSERIRQVPKTVEIGMCK